MMKYKRLSPNKPAAKPSEAKGKRDALAGFKRATDYDFYSRSIDKEK